MKNCKALWILLAGCLIQPLAASAEGEESVSVIEAPEAGDAALVAMAEMPEVDAQEPVSFAGDYSTDDFGQRPQYFGEENLSIDQYPDLYRQAHPDVYRDCCWYAAEPESDCEYARQHHQCGIWLPENPPNFRPFIADPRQVTYSVGWRFNDNILVKNVIPVSFGDTLPIYRWCNIWNGGDLQLELEGAVWAVFDPLHESSPLIDADYYVGFPFSYSNGPWSFRLRGYHISCHMGDEFLLNHPHFDRRNPSTEFLDFAVSYQLTEEIRVYGLVGWRLAQDDSYRLSPWYAEGGVELRLPQLGYRDYKNRLYGEPFYAMHFRYEKDFTRHVDATYALGWEWGKFSGIRRKLRLYLEYHDGYSVEGQFWCYPTNYLTIKGSYGF